MKQEMIDLTRKLVSISSVNTTPGEKEVGLYIEEYLRELPYFKDHPEQIMIQVLKEDVLERRNIIAWIKGEKGESKDAIIFHGHTDTVGVEDYGKLEALAFKSEDLIKAMRSIELPKEVQDDLESGDYLFGRGSCDMKSGDAVFMVLAKKICEEVEHLNGNIILSFNPVEENLHSGIIEAGEVFTQLKERMGLNYVLAINNDYICPLYPGDSHKYIYTGAVGKILPCFYIQGKETHVGQCFEGFDASMIAVELIKELNLNPDYCEGYNGEFTLPPSVLKMKDLKTQYNVQTSFESFVYFNYFIHNATLEEVLERLKKASRLALERVETLLNERYKSYCELIHINYTSLCYETQVVDYSSLLRIAKEKYIGDLSVLVKKMTLGAMKEEKDKREIALDIVKKLCQIADFKKPTIIIFFATPYCPHNTLKEEVAEEKSIYGRLKAITQKVGYKTGESYKILQFFPSLTDSSYLKIDDSKASIAVLKENFPSYQELYPVPLEEIKALDIPAVNFGCYGKDAHKWTERVYIPYSFEVLPQLIMETVHHFLSVEEY